MRTPRGRSAGGRAAGVPAIRRASPAHGGDGRWTVPRALEFVGSGSRVRQGSFPASGPMPAVKAVGAPLGGTQAAVTVRGGSALLGVELHALGCDGERPVVNTSIGPERHPDPLIPRQRKGIEGLTDRQLSRLLAARLRTAVRSAEG